MSALIRTNEELQQEIIKLQKEVERLNSQLKSKKFGLSWIDVPESFEAESENKIPILEEVPDLAIHNDDGKPTHILIEGDNYHALTCLNYTHHGKVDVIYIDPPYNTGSDGFTYKDSRFLTEYPDGTTIPKNHPLRHSVWLSFMEKRLRLAKELLSDKGIIFISINDIEDASLKLLCDDIFTNENKVADIIWQSRKSVSNDTFISNNHNYTIVYFKNVNYWNKGDLNLPATTEKFSNPDNDPRGPWTADPFDAPEVRENLSYPIINPNNGLIFYPPQGRHWRTTQEDYERLFNEGRIVFGKRGLTKPQLKRYIDKAELKGRTPTSIWNDIETTTEGTKLLDKIIGKGKFSNPKPLELLYRIIQIASSRDSVILDFFGGSGTTLHATMQINADDGGNRQCILCQLNEGDICRSVTYMRNKNVMFGYEASVKEVEDLYSEKLSLSKLKRINEYLERTENIKRENIDSYDNISISVKDGYLVVEGVYNKGTTIPGLGNSLKYYRTSFVGKNQPKDATDEDKLTLAKKANCLLSIAENTLYEIESTDYYQLYTDNKGKHTAIYFQEDYAKFEEFRNKVVELEGKVNVYIFSWTNGSEFESEFEFEDNISVKSIPQPILDIYKSLNI